jgi:signal transduction histidine kinase
LRDLHWNPQRHLAAEARRDGRLANLAENKGVWIGRAAETSAERRERFHELRRLTDELRPSVLDQIERQAAVVRESERALETSSVLQRRDYAFCLYPEAQLRAFFGRV